jgi:hypothetical protein
MPAFGQILEHQSATSVTPLGWFHDLRVGFAEPGTSVRRFVPEHLQQFGRCCNVNTAVQLGLATCTVRQKFAVLGVLDRIRALDHLLDGQSLCRKETEPAYQQSGHLRDSEITNLPF